MNGTLVIEAGHTERQYWRDLWRFRELFYLLAWRDFLIRYKQTAVGIAWALIRPLLNGAGPHARRKSRQNTHRRRATSPVLLLRTVAVAIFFHSHVGKWQQPCC